MVKKIVSIILSLALIFVFVAGCTPTSKVKDPQKEKTADPVKVHYILGSGVQSDPEALKTVKDYIIKVTGISPEPYIVPSSSVKEKTNLLLSSTSDPLDMFIDDWRIYAASGAIMPINDLLHQYGSDIEKTIADKDMWSAVSDRDGKIWGIPRLSWVPLVRPMQVRTDWLKKFGLGMPKTIDELENVLKTFRDKDPSGTGSTVPLVTDYQSLLDGMLAGFVEGGNGNWMDKDGKLKPVILHPNFINFITKMNEWYKEGYIYKEAFIAKNEQQQELLKQNKVGVLLTWYSVPAFIYEDLQKAIPGFEMKVNEDIKGPKGGLQTYQGNSPTALLIPKKSKNPEAMMKYVNFHYTDNAWGRIICSYGEEGVFWKKLDKKPDYQFVKGYYETTEDAIKKLSGLEYRFGFAEIEVMRPLGQPYNDYLKHYFQDRPLPKPDMGQKPYDYNVIYDLNKLNQEVPANSDIERMIKEEPIKFIIGKRPLSEWNSFIQSLYKAGMDKRVDALTNQYKELSKK